MRLSFPVASGPMMPFGTTSPLPFSKSVTIQSGPSDAPTKTRLRPSSGTQTSAEIPEGRHFASGESFTKFSPLVCSNTFPELFLALALMTHSYKPSGKDSILRSRTSESRSYSLARPFLRVSLPETIAQSNDMSEPANLCGSEKETLSLMRIRSEHIMEAPSRLQRTEPGEELTTEESKYNSGI